MALHRLNRRDALRLSSISLLTLAGCTSISSIESPTPTMSHPSPTGEVESLPTDHPALTWAVGLSKPLRNPPTVDSDSGRIFVGAGDAGLRPSDVDGSDGPFGALFCLRAEDGKEQWGASTAAPVAGQPVVNDGRVHFVTGFSTGFGGIGHRTVAYALDGTRRWETFSPNGTLSILASVDDMIFAGTYDDAGDTRGQQLFGIRSDGEIRWEREAGDARDATVVNDSLLYSAGNLALVSYNVESGTTDWQIDEEPIGNQRRWLVTVGECCFTQSRSGETTELVARSAIDGSEQWRYVPESFPGDTFIPTGVVNPSSTSDSQYPSVSTLGTEFGGFVFALDDEGTERWTFTTEGDTRSGLAVGDAIYVGDEAGNVYALNPSDGRERWRVSLPDFASLFPLSKGVLAFVNGSDQSVLVSLRHDGSERWRYTTDRNLTWPVIEEGRAYVSAMDGTVLAFDTMG